MRLLKKALEYSLIPYDSKFCLLHSIGYIVSIKSHMLIVLFIG